MHGVHGVRDHAPLQFGGYGGIGEAMWQLNRKFRTDVPRVFDGNAPPVLFQKKEKKITIALNQKGNGGTFFSFFELLCFNKLKPSVSYVGQRTFDSIESFLCRIRLVAQRVAPHGQSTDLALRKQK